MVFNGKITFYYVYSQMPMFQKLSIWLKSSFIAKSPFLFSINNKKTYEVLTKAWQLS